MQKKPKYDVCKLILQKGQIKQAGVDTNKRLYLKIVQSERFQGYSDSLENICVDQNQLTYLHSE